MNKDQENPVRTAVPVLYANDIQSHVSPSDFCLIFNLLLPGQAAKDKPLEKKDLPLSTQTLIYLSPVQAKALRDLLTYQIERYENSYNVLPSTFSSPDSKEG